MRYPTKSVIIGRKKRENMANEGRPCFFAFYSMNKPQTSGKVPDKIVDFEDVHKVIIKALDISYLLEGNDLVINNLEYLEIANDGGHLIVTGKQKEE